MQLPLFKGRRGLSVVVSTLIILVVSVLLATVVTFYAINVTSTRVQEESLLINKQHIWYNSTGRWSAAGLVILNTGGRDVVIDKIAVRGQECSWSNVYYWKTSSVTVQADLNATAVPVTSMTDDMWRETFRYLGPSENFTQANNDLTLKSGWTLVVYIHNPDSISSNDVGRTIGITVFTVNAQYYVEVNVEASG
ncbi:MAG: hypothetical protein RMJ15_06160 [Nitrososphaerota archaeon]|nr:hypothetical protein [Candidatus Bathyarchaeota archaeon]MDW8023301.1 hypothetical protein [Nitrososphaerota archaeon]